MYTYAAVTICDNLRSSEMSQIRAAQTHAEIRLTLSHPRTVKIASSIVLKIEFEPKLKICLKYKLIHGSKSVQN